MDDTDGIAIVRLGPDDAPDGLLLSTETHWNQNEADWRFFLNQGIVFGVRAEGGQLVATAALLPYSAGNAWISMVLVTESWRRRGLATKTGRYLSQCRDQARPDLLARRHAGGRRRLRPARFHADAATAAAAAGEFDTSGN